jgi:hypothetical protein
MPESVRMAMSPSQVKFIAIAVVIIVVCLLVVSIVWDALKIAVGMIVGLGLIYLGIRFILGKGLPPAMKKVADKALKAAKDDTRPE